MAETPAGQVQIEVGNGPITRSGVIGSIVAYLGFIGSLLATALGSLPAGVDPNVGVGLTIASGVVATAIHAFTGLSRAKFADAKAKVMAGQSGYEVLTESLVLPEADPEPAEPTDTSVQPPVEP